MGLVITYTIYLIFLLIPFLFNVQMPPSNILFVVNFENSCLDSVA